MTSFVEPNVAQKTADGWLAVLHLHLWPSRLPSQAKWRTRRLSNAIGQDCLCVVPRILMLGSIKSLRFWVYTRQTALTPSINIWEKEKVCLVWGRLWLPFLWLQRCPQFPVWVCQSGGRSENWLLFCCCLAIGEARTLPQQPNSKLRAVPALFYVVKSGDWNLHWTASFSTSHFFYSNNKYLFYYYYLSCYFCLRLNMGNSGFQENWCICLFVFSQAYSDEDQKTWSDQLCKALDILNNSSKIIIFIKRMNEYNTKDCIRFFTLFHKHCTITEWSTKNILLETKGYAVNFCLHWSMILNLCIKTSDKSIFFLVNSFSSPCTDLHYQDSTPISVYRHGLLK